MYLMFTSHFKGLVITGAFPVTSWDPLGSLGEQLRWFINEAAL